MVLISDSKYAATWSNVNFEMRILIACNEGNLGARIEADLRSYREFTVTRVKREEMTRSLASYQPSVVVLTVGLDPARDLQLIREFALLAPSTNFGVVGPATDPKFILQVLREGVGRYIDETEFQSELVEFIHEIGRSPQSHSATTGRLVAVLGLSGGAGATTIVLNCAVESARLQNKVALIDLDLRKADLAPMLNIAPDHTIADFCKNLSRMDDVMFGQCFVPHSSGVQLLAAPIADREISDVTPERILCLVMLARQRFPEIWVDIGDYYQPESTAVLTVADQILCVLRQDFTSLQHAVRFMGFLSDHQIPPNRVSFVIGKYGQSKALGLKDVESALGSRILTTIPEDAASANEATNSGKPVLLGRPNSGLSKAIKLVTDKLTQATRQV